jgi:predicted Zn-dependent protease
MSQGELAESGGAALAIGLGGSASSSAILAAYGLGAQCRVLLPYGRTRESKADHIGLLLIAQAGYDPRVAIDFWERMEQTSRGGSPEVVSTHPSHGARITQLRTRIPEAMRLYAATTPAPNAPLVTRRQREALITSGREKNFARWKKFFSKMRATLQRHDTITALPHLAIHAEAR